MWSHISRTKTCLEAEMKKKELHLQWERENERRRARKEELEKELQRQVGHTPVYLLASAEATMGRNI